MSEKPLENSQSPSKEDRVISASEQKQDKTWDLTLRPQALADYIGQEQVKANLDIVLQAAKGRGEPMDHVLLFGPPGLGKTTCFDFGKNLLRL